MSDLIVYGFPRSTFVNIVRLVLTHKDVPYRFHDLEPEMGKPSHLALHPFNRVPVLRHDDFTIYETSRSEEHTSELQSLRHLVCRLLLEKKKINPKNNAHN